MRRYACCLGILPSTYHVQEGYELEHVPHALLSLSGDFASDVRKGCEIVQSWLASVNACKRERVSAAHLKIALQCGGSYDSFSLPEAIGLSACIGTPSAALVGTLLLLQCRKLPYRMVCTRQFSAIGYVNPFSLINMASLT